MQKPRPQVVGYGERENLQPRTLIYDTYFKNNIDGPIYSPVKTVWRVIPFITALESIPISMMRKFSNRFMDAYSRGLNGRQAAWASRKYRGHRVLPNDIMELGNCLDIL